MARPTAGSTTSTSTPAACNRNSQGISGKFGSAFELTQKLTGEASAGYIRRHYDDPQLPSFGAYLIDASLIFTASALTTLSASPR